MDEADETYRFLRERRAELVERIEVASARSGRTGNDVTLLAVSKTVASDVIEAAYAAGYRAFGENRPQELVRKAQAAAESPHIGEIRFDLIGNLQTNKINQVLGVSPTLIHSVSSTHLAGALSRRAQGHGQLADVLLEVNVSGEASKAGFSPGDVLADAEALAAMEGIRLRGVMAMAPAHDIEAARRTFSGLRDVVEGLRVRTGLGLPVMSCGMSDDFEVAIEEGSNLVRLGRIVFDPAYQSV